MERIEESGIELTGHSGNQVRTGGGLDAFEAIFSPELNRLSRSAGVKLRDGGESVPRCLVRRRDNSLGNMDFHDEHRGRLKARQTAPIKELP